MPRGVPSRPASGPSARALASTAVVLATLAVATSASAQQPPAPLPPPAQGQPPQGAYGQPYPQQPPPPGYGQPYPQQPYPQQPPPPGYGQPYPQQPYPQQPYPQQPYPQQPYPQQPPPAVQPPPRQAPPPVEYKEPEVPTHAPKYSLWVGPRLSYMGFGFSWFVNREGKSETTGNFVGNGPATQLDLGARISHRYVPYVFWEHAFLPAGHRFEGDSASAHSDFYGIGFRMISGDANSVGFLTDLSIGKRVVTVSNGGQSYSMSGLEIFKLGLGAEIRVTTLLAITPLFSISGGSMNDTSGTVKFSAAGSQDGITEPAFKNGETIENTRAYVMLSLGVGVHFDVFGE